MFKRIRTLLIILLVVVLLLSGAVAAFGPGWARQTSAKSFPQIEGTVTLPGLDSTVEIYRDTWGVPHIYAATTHDLFAAQGYVHAQERFWQMDFWRHQGAGRLSELLGKATLDTDKFLRTLGWERTAEAELALLDAPSRAILEAYTDGVNAYISGRENVELGLEYAFLPLLNRGYEPAPWTMVNSLTWGKAMAWDLRDYIDPELDRALLSNDLTAEHLADLFPPYPGDHPLIVPGFGNGIASMDIQPADLSLDSLSGMFLDARTASENLDAITGGGFEGIGSNSWAISGELSATGMPLLANDPHLGSQMPSIWYEVGLHCLPKTEECPLDVAGFSFAGVPGVVIGHNDRIAWGFTNVGPDVMDVYIEKINPENEFQYEFEGEWVDMDVFTETIEIAGGDPSGHTVRVTRHGPIITEDYGLDTFAEDAGIELPENFALAVRWTALEPSCIFCSVWQINAAQNWDDFRQAAQDWAVPAQNLLYADVDGNIGYQMPGRIPIRSAGHSGLDVVPGWTGEYEWQGYIPFEELPHTLNPAAGYIATANNAVVDSSYPYMITTQWDYGYRAARIVELIEGAPGPIDADFIHRIQGDNLDLLAADLLPVLAAVELTDPALAEARSMLLGWDQQLDMDSAPAALYMAFWRNLLNRTFVDDLPEFYNVGVESGAREIVRRLLDEPQSPWWDDAGTEAVETRDDIFATALADGYAEIRKLQGRDPAGWAWGDAHTITFNNQVMSSFPLINRAFNRGPFPTSGGSAIINATGWDEAAPYLVDWLPSMRMVVDLGDLTASHVVNTTGQSGHPYHPHYIDQADLWRTIEYRPMLWDADGIKTDTEGLLVLQP